MVNWRLSHHFVILSGVRQGYMVAPSLFNTAMTYSPPSVSLQQTRVYKLLV